MDLTIFRSYYTVILLLIFVGIWIWAWSRRNKSRFNNAANSLFDEKEEQVHAASLEEKADESNHGAENKS
ncbi:MAG: cbb3-type cytochrome c oxidase subunit 3 [Gammaproteobacteria bacterium]|nr:cbb3-type cytochrome c oxidase subunit 3 [Gammaproteobacteria bacterium]